MNRVYRLASVFFGIVLVIILLLVLGFDYFFELSNSEGYRNSKACPALKPGIAISDLKLTFGEPLESEDRERQWLAFRANSIAAGPIRARVDKTTGKVIELHCNEDGPPTWIMRLQ